MKKIFMVLLLTLMFALVLCGCSQTPSNTDPDMEDTDDVVDDGLYQVLIFGFSDSVPSANHKIEYEFADHDKYEHRTIDNRVECLINGKKYVGDYTSSQYSEYNYFPVNRYVGNDGITFEIDESGVLTSCFWGNDSLSGEKKTQEDCVEIAKNFLETIVDINNYDIAVEDNVERGLYTVKFTKSIHGIKTTDSATIVVKYDGDLYSYSSFMIGRVNKDLDSFDNIKVDNVKKSINNKLNQIYKDAKSVYSRIDYSEPDIKFTMLKDGSVGAVCTVEVRCVDVLGEYEVFISDRIRLVVINDQEENNQKQT